MRVHSGNTSLPTQKNFMLSGIMLTRIFSAFCFVLLSSVIRHTGMSYNHSATSLNALKNLKWSQLEPFLSIVLVYVFVHSCTCTPVIFFRSHSLSVLFSFFQHILPVPQSRFQISVETIMKQSSESFSWEKHFWDVST